MCCSQPIHSPSLLAPDDVASVRVGGRVREVRDSGLVVADALATVEVALASAAKQVVAVGDLVVVAGKLSAGGLEAARIERVLHRRSSGGQLVGAERDNESARLGRGGVADNLQRRAAIIATIRRWLTRRGYLEVETPAVVVSPGLDLHLGAFAVGEAAAAGSPTPSGYLITSPEYQMKRLLAGGLPRIFELARCFRTGERGARHSPEFTMLEWYRAFCDADQMMDETEALLRAVLEAHCSGDGSGTVGVAVDWTRPFVRLTLAQAFERFAAVREAEMLRLAERDEDRFFRLLVEQIEPALGQQGVPVFLHRYPAQQASLARLADDDRRYAERFELYFGDLELCNGFAELTDPVEQRARLLADQARRRAAGKPAYPLDERFLGALEEGMPPAAGNALGLDRLAALCCDVPAIGLVQAIRHAQRHGGRSIMGARWPTAGVV